VGITAGSRDVPGRKRPVTRDDNNNNNNNNKVQGREKWGVKCNAVQ